MKLPNDSYVIRISLTLKNKPHTGDKFKEENFTFIVAKFCACFIGKSSGGFLMCFFECMQSKLRPCQNEITNMLLLLVLKEY